MTTISQAGSANSTTSSATLVVGSVTAAVGDLLVLAVAADNSGTSGAISLSTSVTDAAGNTWVNQKRQNQAPGSVANGGTTLGLWTCKVTNALSAQNVTINFSPNTPSKAAIIYKMVPAAGESIDLAVVGGVGAGNSGSATSHAAASENYHKLGRVAFGFSAVETNLAVTADSDTTDGTWSSAYQAVANSGSDLTSQTVSGQYKVTSAFTTGLAYNTTTAAAKDYAVCTLLFDLVAVKTNVIPPETFETLGIVSAGGGQLNGDLGGWVSYALIYDAANVPILTTSNKTQGTNCWKIASTADLGGGQFINLFGMSSFVLSSPKDLDCSGAITNLHVDIFCENVNAADYLLVVAYSVSDYSDGVYYRLQNPNGARSIDLNIAGLSNRSKVNFIARIASGTDPWDFGTNVNGVAANNMYIDNLKLEALASGKSQGIMLGV